MKSENRFVFDNGTLVSAALFESSIPAQALAAAMERGQLLVSAGTLLELREVLGRAKFDRYLPAQVRAQFIQKVTLEGQAVETMLPVTACRDPKDDKFLELAVNGAASCLVASDQDLLVLNPFRGIPILTPVQFLEWLAAQQPASDA